MRRRLEPALPIVVLVGFLAAALLVNFLLSDAEERGVDALEQAVLAEVDALADSQDQRFVNTFDTVDADDERLRLEFTVGSERDKALIASFGEQVALRAIIVAPDGTVTYGGHPSAVGTPFSWPGVAPGSDALSEEGLLPVAEAGYTTEAPVFAYVFPIPVAGGTSLGTVLLETVIGPEEAFNQEIGRLQRGRTGRFFFIDGAGTVIASNDLSAIGAPIGDDRIVEGDLGLRRLGGDVVAISEVPAAGWRVVFRQDADEFEEALAGPLRSVGRILVLGLLAGGALVTWLLYRRLRAARAEEARLHALSEAQEELVSIVSHELRTPVAGVLGFLETSLDHWDVMEDSERKAAVSRAAVNARRLQALTRDVLDTQNLEAGRLVHVFERLDLREELQAAVEAAADLDPHRPVEVELPDAPIWVRADGDRLQQVLANLLDNARKSSPAVEAVTLAVRVGATDAEVAVSDHGPGIEEAARERIFEKFVRGRSDSVGGTGLGLFISRQIVEAHGGRIWVDSTPGEGATFRFTLPLDPDEGAQVKGSPP